MIISIEGNIGSGKSTLLQNLKDYYCHHVNIIFVDEPLSEWEKMVDLNDGENILQKFYKNQETFAFSFQMMAYISRLALLKEIYTKSSNCIIICERSLFTDKHIFAKMLYDDGKIHNIDYQIYQKWFNTFAQDFPIDKFIYVNTNPLNCYARVTKRSRMGENNISLEYLQNCDKYHNEMMEQFDNVWHIDGNADINYNENQMLEWIHSINANIINEFFDKIVHNLPTDRNNAICWGNEDY